MTEEVNMVLDMTRDSMIKTIEHLDVALSQVRAGKSDTRMLDSVMVDYYGTPTPLSQVSNVNTPDARTIKIQPWEKNMIAPIEKAIMYANLGVNPSNNGEAIIINVPALTEDRRRDLVKQAKSECENAKIGLRNARKDAIDQFKQMQKDGLSEDVAKDSESKAQVLVGEFSSKIDEMLKQKEIDIMTV